jgi:anti-sigma factor RsiW
MAELSPACREFDEDLSALIDEELDAAREAAVRAHVDGCDRCAARLQALCDVDLELAGLGQPEVPGDLGQRLAARIANDPGAPPMDKDAATPFRRPRTDTPRQPRRGLGRTLGALAAVAAAVVLAVVLWSRRPSEVTPEGLVARSTPEEPRPETAPAAPAPAEGGETIAATPEAATPQPAAVDLDAVPDEDLAVVLDLDTMEDLDVIANLELLERLVEMEAVEG